MTKQGEKIVRADFNPSGSKAVTEIKTAAAVLLDVIERHRVLGDMDERCASIAITNIEQGAMWAVKAATATKK